MLQSVLAGGGVHHQQSFVGGSRHDPLRRPAHLFKFRHQIGLGVQTASRVDDHVVSLARRGSLQGIKQHCRGISSSLGLDHFRAGALSPNFELLDGGGAKGIGGAHQNVLALRAKHLCQLADSRGLAGPVYSHDEDDFGRAVDFLNRLRVGRGQNRQQFLFQQALQFVDVLDLLAVGLLAQLLEDLVRGGCTQVGANQGRFQVVESVAVDFLVEGNRVFDALGQVLARARDGFLHTVQETRFLLLFEAAKKGLNHRALRTDTAKLSL